MRFANANISICINNSAENASAARHNLALLGQPRDITALAEESQTVRQVAERLGYSEPRAFRRAFQRWTGKSPNHFRQGRVTAIHDSVRSA